MTKPNELNKTLKAVKGMTNLLKVAVAVNPKIVALMTFA
jgi:hypothetical protein